MSLVKCPECGHEVSDRAAACPLCGLVAWDILKGEEGEREREKTRHPPGSAATEPPDPVPAKPDCFSLWSLFPIGCCVVAVVWFGAWSWAAEMEKSRVAAGAKPGDIFAGLLAGLGREINALFAFPILFAGLLGAAILHYKRVQPRRLIRTGLALDLLAFPILMGTRAMLQ